MHDRDRHGCSTSYSPQDETAITFHSSFPTPFSLPLQPPSGSCGHAAQERQVATYVRAQTRLVITVMFQGLHIQYSRSFAQTAGGQYPLLLHLTACHIMNHYKVPMFSKGMLRVVLWACQALLMLLLVQLPKPHSLFSFHCFLFYVTAALTVTQQVTPSGITALD